MPEIVKCTDTGASYDAIVEQAQTLHGLQRLYWAVKDDVTHAPVKPDNELVAANSPEPDVTLLSPAFIWPDSVPSAFDDGTTGPTNNATLDCFLRSLAERNDWCRYRGADLTSEEGRALPLVFLSASSRSAGSSNGTPSDKLRVWLQGAVHGNEPSGDQALLALLGKMDDQKGWACSLLSKMDIVILPRYNADGGVYFQRAFASNFDPNRDHIKLAHQQTRDIKQVFTDFSPHISVDMHEYLATSTYAGFHRHGADVMFSAAKNLNIHDSIRSMSENLFAPAIFSALEAGGFRWEPYVTGTTKSTHGGSITLSEASSDAKIGRNAVGLTQCISFVCETRGIGLASQHFARRTAAALTMVESILQTAHDNASNVLSTVNNAIEAFTNSTDHIVITDTPNQSTRTFTMIDTRDGILTQLPITFNSTTPANPILTRPRPRAYLVPATYADLASRLRILGLEVQNLPHPYRGTVQALLIKSVSYGCTYFEGVVPVTVTTKAVEKEVELEKGSFWVGTAQKNAGLAFVALEPEGGDSWVSCNVLGVEEGEEYPVYRVMK